MLKLENRITFIYLDKTSINTKDNALTLSSGETLAPARFAAILLGPGTSITHAAIKLIAEHQTRILWVGEECLKIYGAGEPLTDDAIRIEAQVLAATKAIPRHKVLRYMYSKRFPGETIPSLVDAATFRAKEGTIARMRYHELAAQHQITWHKRVARKRTDQINTAIDIANGYLYQVATCAILAAGYSPAIGFVHHGFERSFSADIADLYKFSISVPIAFEVTASKPDDLVTAIRHKIRDKVREMNLLDVMISDCKGCMYAAIANPTSK